MPNPATEWDSAARAELLGQVAFYRAEREDLGRRFLEAVRSSIEVVKAFPGVGRPWHEPIHRETVRGHRVRGFPFAVYYLVLEERTIILAVAHDRRDQDYWAGRTRRWLG